jgi:hypothetical protein
MSTVYVFVIQFLLASCGCDLASLSCRSLVACDQTTEVEEDGQCIKKTRDERAMIALNQGDFGLAAMLLEELVSDEPLEYFRYPRLAAAYGGLAGFDIFNIVKLDFGGGQSFLPLIQSIVPSPQNGDVAGYQPLLSSMNAAVTTLLSMPVDERSAGKTSYGASAAFQLTLFQAAFSVMYLNQFFFSPTSGIPDGSQLEAMTDADVTLIMNSLKAASEGQGNEKLTQKIDQAVAQIEGSNGSVKDGLIQYMNQNGQK